MQERQSIGSRAQGWDVAWTTFLLIIGYAGFYLCRSNLSVTRTLIIDEFASSGFTKETIGGIVSLATLFYAFGKFLAGAFADKHGGRVAFLVGLTGAVLFNILFGTVAGVPMFTLAWCGNRFAQSFGWPGIVKLGGNWFAPSAYGSMMGLVSLSYLFGDFASRKFHGYLLSTGLGWRQVFLISSGILAAYGILAFFTLRENPKSLDRSGQDISEAETRADGPSIPLFGNPAFWFACAMSFSFTLLRETFNEWTPTLLEEVGKLSKPDAANASSYFPLAGGFSVLIVGWLSDRIGSAKRGILILVSLLLSGAALAMIAKQLPVISSTALTLGVASVAFLLLGPYALLAGAISLDLGGKRSAALASGWVDGIGYLGGILSGLGVATLVQRSSWSTAFYGLSILCLATSLLAYIFIVTNQRRLKVKLP